VSAAHVLGPNIPAPHGSSIPEVAAAWATRDGCGATPASHTAAAGVTLFAFPCPAGTDVELYRVRGGGRAWPGSPISKDLSFLGPTAMDISATSLMWDFFVTHPLVH
jgi:polyhydroxybutyrate depolymerase